MNSLQELSESSTRRGLLQSVERHGEQIALALLLVSTAALYLWGLSASGWANSFYSAAAQAGSKSWKAFFFGSSDAANSITVDKPPLALWPMVLSVRLFGLNAWSILVPQALGGVATVALVFVTIKRWFGALAGLIAGAVMACTPVAVLMFRYNNPDAVLVLLLVSAAYFTTRAIEDGRTRWMALAGAMVGLAFLAKALQAFIVVPILAIAFLLAAPAPLWKRLRDTIVMGVTTLLAGGWWVLIVELWPKSSRPYIGGSQDNTFLNVLFGYNGLGRITGDEPGSVGGLRGIQGAGRWGETGITRMFNPQFGGQASWLLPASLLVILIGSAVTFRRPRIDRARTAIVLWGGWLVVNGLVFSFSKGIIHEYYTVVLAPAIGALIGIGASEMWRKREYAVVRNVLAFMVALSAGWSFVLLERVPNWQPWLRWTVLGIGLVLALSLVLAGRTVLDYRVPLVLGLVGVTMAGPVAFSLETATRSYGGARPLAGPDVRRNLSGMFGAFGGQGGAGDGSRLNQLLGPLQSNAPSDEVIRMLLTDADEFTWIAAAIGSNQAAIFQLTTQRPVMPIGGFNSTDPSPTLEQFKKFVADGRIHYFISTGLVVRGALTGLLPSDLQGNPGNQGGANPVFGPGSGPGGFLGSPQMGASDIVAQEILTWAAFNFEYVTIDGTTYYDLTRPTMKGESP